MARPSKKLYQLLSYFFLAAFVALFLGLLIVPSVLHGLKMGFVPHGPMSLKGSQTISLSEIANLFFRKVGQVLNPLSNSVAFFIYAGVLAVFLDLHKAFRNRADSL